MVRESPRLYGIQYAHKTIAEIQELRHGYQSSTSTQPTSSSSTPSTSRLDTLILALDTSSVALAPQIASICAESDGLDKNTANAAAELKAEWERVTSQHGMLQQELREDGWLVRFRT